MIRLPSTLLSIPPRGRRACRAALLAAPLLLAACTGPTEPVPFAVEHGGALPEDSYRRLDTLAAARPAEVRMPVAGRPHRLPLLAHAYWVRPDLAPGSVRALRIGRFAALPGQPERAAQIAAGLPGEIRRRLAAQHVFPEVTELGAGEAAAPGDLVLTGTVTRLIDSDGPAYGRLGAAYAGVQIEAELRQDGRPAGAMQVNAAERVPDMMTPSPLLLLASAVVMAVKSSRTELGGEAVAGVLSAWRGGKPEEALPPETGSKAGSS